jgi:signal transduction histidine kinase
MIELQLTVRGPRGNAARLREVLAREGFILDGDWADEGSALRVTVSHEAGDASLQAAAREIEELDATLRELRNLDVAKSQFLANVSHELRTPLTAIVTYGEVLRDGLLGDLNDRQREAISSVIGSSRQLLSMIEEILTYARTSAKAIELAPVHFQVADLIRTAHDMSASLMRKKGIRFEWHVDQGLPSAAADRDKILHVLTNLLGNAIEFTPSEDGVIRVSAVRAEDDTRWICVTVEDNGIGIDPAHHEMIFREFAQVDSSRARQHHGTGLGLAIARNFIHLHGGHITLDSELGRGSRFSFTFPSIEAEAREGSD